MNDFLFPKVLSESEKEIKNLVSFAEDKIKENYDAGCKNASFEENKIKVQGSQDSLYCLPSTQEISYVLSEQNLVAFISTKQSELELKIVDETAKLLTNLMLEKKEFFPAFDCKHYN